MRCGGRMIQGLFASLLMASTGIRVLGLESLVEWEWGDVNFSKSVVGASERSGWPYASLRWAQTIALPSAGEERLETVSLRKP